MKRNKSKGETEKEKEEKKEGRERGTEGRREEGMKGGESHPFRTNINFLVIFLSSRLYPKVFS